MDAVLEDEYGISELSGRAYWEAELKNKKILLRKTEQMIYGLTANGGVQSYTIDTGQDKQTVTREQLGSLYATQRDLTQQIAQLEMQLNNSAPKRITPGY